MNRLGVSGALLFTLPLLFSIFSGFLGVEFSSRDDLNYLSELADISILEPRLDYLSWITLSLVTSAFGLNSGSLRLIGFLIATATVATLIYRTNRYRTLIFIASVLPLYINIYFSQLRLGIAIFIFVLVITISNFRKLAVILGALGHISFLFILFLPITSLFIFLKELISQLDYVSALSVKLDFYLGNELIEIPWYFGWELLLVALVFGWQNKWMRFLEIFVVMVIVRIIGADLSLDIARRVLELGILAYSPFFLLELRNERVSRKLVYCYLILGVIQVPMSIYSGVIGF